MSIASRPEWLVGRFVHLSLWMACLVFRKDVRVTRGKKWRRPYLTARQPAPDLDPALVRSRD